MRNALNPAAINRVAVRDYESRDIEVIVAEDQLSLAIGRKGQNVRLASKLVGWNLDIKSEAEKKGEVEAEMERMAAASRELAMLPGIEPAISTRLLDAGFRTVEEVSLASMDDLTTIDGVDEETAISIHDAAETLVEQLREEAARIEEEEAAAAALAEEQGDDETGEETEEAAAAEEETDAETATVDEAAGTDQPTADAPEASGEQTPDDTADTAKTSEQA